MIIIINDKSTFFIPTKRDFEECLDRNKGFYNPDKIHTKKELRTWKR